MWLTYDSFPEAKLIIYELRVFLGTKLRTKALKNLNFANPETINPFKSSLWIISSLPTGLGWAR